MYWISRHHPEWFRWIVPLTVAGIAAFYLVAWLRDH